MRKLATIRQITSITPIEGADNIELAQVDGWQVVVKRGDFDPGDLAVYVEIDSVLPERAEFEFLRSRRFRVKTIKLRGQLSQGILFPMEILPPLPGSFGIGNDVTEVLGIKKYEPKEVIEENTVVPRKHWWIDKYLMRYAWYRRWRKGPGNKKGLPPWVRKTDEERIQNLPHMPGKPGSFRVTEKLDGSTITCYLKKERGVFTYSWVFGVCSRNVHLTRKDPNNKFWEAVIRLKIEAVMRSSLDTRRSMLYVVGSDVYVSDSIVLQGELVGPGIQGNKYGLKESDIYFFTMYIDGQRQGPIFPFGVKAAPWAKNYNHNLPSLSELLKDADGPSKLNQDVLREGIVVRNFYTPEISFKVISNEWLLKYGE